MDGRYSLGVAPEGFTNTGRTIAFSHGSDEIAFPVFAKNFDSGTVRFDFRLTADETTEKHGVMSGIFVLKQELTLSNMAVTGTDTAPVHTRIVSGSSVKFASNRDP